MTIIAWTDNGDIHHGVTTSGASVWIQRSDCDGLDRYHTDFDGTTRWYDKLEQAKEAADRILEFSDRNPKCEGCEWESPDVQYQIDPYAAEIHGVEIWRWMCDHCLKTAAEDV